MVKQQASFQACPLNSDHGLCPRSTNARLGTQSPISATSHLWRRKEGFISSHFRGFSPLSLGLLMWACGARCNTPQRVARRGLMVMGLGRGGREEQEEREKGRYRGKRREMWKGKRKKRGRERGKKTARERMREERQETRKKAERKEGGWGNGPNISMEGILPATYLPPHSAPLAALPPLSMWAPGEGAFRHSLKFTAPACPHQSTSA